MMLAAALLVSAAPWPDTPQARVEALAVLQTLNANLLSHDSATLTLDRWCADHHIAQPATVVAERVRGEDKPATADIRAALKVTPDMPVAYRRVRLRCGDHVLSDADNWYVPARLTAAMNDALEQSDIAFGRAVQALHFARHTLSATLLWSPLPDGREMTGLPGMPLRPGRLAIPDHVLEHRAILATPDGTPFSLVVESYTSAVLDFPPPAG
ncbi:hypothetical protein [Sphingomonas abietis]|uniref:Uncharacterized protein n=1 Tax=Sphingomonas abietis TaxID=3012344 RepID=A0ABY7NTV6_9SPHN|nr:hypothetical protein [Sphingomonas abietis]WBO23369.1 hypothetical protein PBT88_04345 [Sphingomonas abietis]